jgi:hypothetical protein
LNAEHPAMLRIGAIMGLIRQLDRMAAELHTARARQNRPQ